MIRRCYELAEGAKSSDSVVDVVERFVYFDECRVKQSAGLIKLVQTPQNVENLPQQTYTPFFTDDTSVVERLDRNTIYRLKTVKI